LAQSVVSLNNDVSPITGGAGSTAILPNVAGAWATLRSTGSVWQIIAKGQ
jgi:hypothetical protein